MTKGTTNGGQTTARRAVASAGTTVGNTPKANDVQVKRSNTTSATGPVSRGNAKATTALGQPQEGRSKPSSHRGNSLARTAPLQTASQEAYVVGALADYHADFLDLETRQWTKSEKIFGAAVLITFALLVIGYLAGRL